MSPYEVYFFRLALATIEVDQPAVKGEPEVSRKRKKRGRADEALAAPVLKARVEKALREGRSQQALDLAHTLHKRDPSPPHKDLLQKASLERARQLRSAGHDRDARIVLESAARLDGAPAFLEQVARELAAVGDAPTALKLLERVPGSSVMPQVLGHAADAAIRQGKSGRNLLPAALQPQFDLFMQAQAQVEAGQDEPARTTLQGIGLQSPFLEWKVLLRGLMAYYQKDDTRALENWQRLNAERLPARVAAPLRFLIDPPFRTAQAPDAQAALQGQADRLQGAELVPVLRAIQRDLAHERHLPQAFRQAEKLLPALRAEVPHLGPRLASCFYWAIISHGQPEDLNRYQRVFGRPPDDPDLARLEALALEHRHIMPDAHKAWQRFEKTVAAHPSAWPIGQADRVRALVWLRMAENADAVPDVEDLPDLPPFLRDHPDRPRPLKPSAEECYKRSLELAPDQLETHFKLFEHYQHTNKTGKAEQAARKLLQPFPDHAPTLEALGDLLMSKTKYAEALGLFERAMKSNPLERRLRGKLGTAHSYKARQDAEQGRFEESRLGYQAALAYSEGDRNYPVLCKWAACEFKANNLEMADELLQRAHAEEDNRLAVAFSMLIETIRFKLPKKLKDRFDREVKEHMAQPPTARAAGAIADTAAAMRAAGVTYYGQKTHEKRVLTYLEKALQLQYTEDQLAGICDSLRVLQSPRLHQKFTRLGQQLFPSSPVFYLAEAEYNLSQGPHRCPSYQTQELLEKAQRLANAMPRDPRQQKLLERIQRHLDAVQLLNPFSRLFGGGPMDFFDPFDEDDDFDDEDDGYF
jgi:tetratricopeptide (TPR) repeat protein